MPSTAVTITAKTPRHLISMVPTAHQAITDGNDATFSPAVECIFVGGAGTLTLTMDGVTALYTAFAGQEIFGTFTALTAGTATKLIARKY